MNVEINQTYPIFSQNLFSETISGKDTWGISKVRLDIIRALICMINIRKALVLKY